MKLLPVIVIVRRDIGRGLFLVLSLFLGLLAGCQFVTSPVAQAEAAAPVESQEVVAEESSPAEAPVEAAAVASDLEADAAVASQV